MKIFIYKNLYKLQLSNYRPQIISEAYFIHKMLSNLEN